MQQSTHDRTSARVEEIQAFLAVARTGSFTRAAEDIGRDGSTVSRRVAALEARLGVRLIARTTRQLALTEAGNRYEARMRAVFEDLASADEEVRAHGDVPQGLLRVTVPKTFGRLCVVPLLPAFLAAHPKVRVAVHHADHLVDLVGEGFDVAVRLGRLTDSTLVARRLAPARHLLVASSKYLRAHGTPRRPQDLSAHRALAFGSGGPWTGWTLHRGAERVAVAPTPAMTADDPESLVTAAAGGAGIAVATDWLLARHAQRHLLKPVLPGWQVGDDGAIHAVTPAARHLPAKTRAFVDALVAALRPA